MLFRHASLAGLSDVVQRVGAGEKQPMLAINGLTGLMSFVQAGVAEFHPWGCRAGHLEQPDRLIFDLDPGEDAPWEAVIEAARELRDRPETCSLKSFVKTSGSKGLHVVVPVEPLAGWDEAIGARSGRPRAPAQTSSPPRSPNR